jgi:multidrug resistance protein, MATE family
MGPIKHAPTAADYRELLTLAGPIVLIQVGTMLMGVVDTIMVGRSRRVALAAVALANLYSFGIMIFGLGVLMALDPVIAQALGANDELAVAAASSEGSSCRDVDGADLAIAVDGRAVLTLAGNRPRSCRSRPGTCIAERRRRLPFYAFVVLRQTLQAHRSTRPIVVDDHRRERRQRRAELRLIFGHFGFPELGVLGSAWATLASRWLMAGLFWRSDGRPIGDHLEAPAPNCSSRRRYCACCCSARRSAGKWRSSSARSHRSRC